LGFAPTPPPGRPPPPPLCYTHTHPHANQEFCWEDHGYSLLAKYFPVAADLVDKLLATTFTLTYHDFGTESGHIDTDAFRQAIW
jgi:hypothetical protein